MYPNRWGIPPPLIWVALILPGEVSGVTEEYSAAKIASVDLLSVIIEVSSASPGTSLLSLLLEPAGDIKILGVSSVPVSVDVLGDVPPLGEVAPERGSVSRTSEGFVESGVGDTVALGSCFT